MNPVSGPALGAAVLLLAAGLPKLRDPLTTSGALRSVGWPAGSTLVRAGAAAEVLIAAGALAVGGSVAWALVAAGYLGFSVFLVVALRRGGAVSSCGCVGRPDTPPTRLHLALTVGLAAVATAAAAVSAPGLSGVDWARGADLMVVAYALVVGWLAWAVIAPLPSVLAFVRPAGRPAGPAAPVS